VQLTATAAAGWEFSGWSGDLSSADNPATITMDDNKNVTANFVAVPQHTLTVSVDPEGGGTVNLNPSQETYNEDTEVVMTATATAGWEFSGWSGDLISADNPATVTMDGDKFVTATFTELAYLYSEAFNDYAAGSNPDDWLDTAANNSMTEDDSLFEVFDLGGEKVFGTTSTATNIHSHLMDSGIDTYSGYEYSGRMMMTASTGGIGVTFFSQYPATDTYYRLRRYRSNAFHISPHGATVNGDTDTGVVPSANAWYRFRVRVQDTGARTEIRARVWPDGSSEPTEWQVNCFDDSGTRLTAGKIGVWSYYSGSKYWDDLAVYPLTP
jgi:uncharacterized repeat protein (TIGR02543 family)